MKKMLISATAVAMFFAAGCSNEELVQNQQTESREFSLTVNKGAESRTVMEGNVNKWDENDAVYVFSEDGTVYGVLNIDWATVSNEGKTATFRGTVNGDATLKHVVFPAPQGNIPTPAELMIGTSEINGAEHNAPMYGEINGENSTFEYLGGLVKLEIKGVNEDQELILNAEANGVPVNNGRYVWDARQNEMVLKNGSGETIVKGLNGENTVVYLPVAVDTNYDQAENAPKATITGKLRDGQNEPVQVLSLSNVAISKNDIGNTEGDAIEIPEGILKPREVSSWSELSEAVGNNEETIINVVLKSSIEDANSLIKIPEGKIVTIDLNEQKIEGEADYYLIQSNGTLNMRNGDLIANSMCAVCINKGDANFENVDITAKENIAVVCYGSLTDKEKDTWQKGAPSNKVVMNGGSVTMNSKNYGGNINYAIYCQDNCEIELNNVNVTSEGGGVQLNCGRLDVYGGKIEGKGMCAINLLSSIVNYRKCGLSSYCEWENHVVYVKNSNNGWGPSIVNGKIYDEEGGVE